MLGPATGQVVTAPRAPGIRTRRLTVRECLRHRYQRIARATSSLSRICRITAIPERTTVIGPILPLAGRKTDIAMSRMIRVFVAVMRPYQNQEQGGGRAVPVLSDTRV